LLDASIRKRAWPILTSCHLAILGDTCATPRRSVPPSQSDLRALRHDVKQTVWDITEYLQNKPTVDSAQSKPQGQDQSFSEALVPSSITQRDPRRVSFSVDKRYAIKEETEDDDGIPSIRLTPTDTSDDEVNEVTCSMINATMCCDDRKAVQDMKTAFLSNEPSTSGRRVRWRKASKYEQNIVANVIISVLRTPASEHSSFADDRFHYYSGLHNLTAILLANLESPSLTSMILYVD
jgi:hypothetical protein